MTNLLPSEPAPLEWHRVSRRYVVVDVVGYLVTTVILTAVASIPYWIARADWLLLIPAVVAIVGLTVLAFTPRRVRSIGYALRDDDIVFARGIAWRRAVAIPYGRMQLIDVTAGPLARALGLSELRFVTAAASGSIVVPGLPTATAEDLRDRLVALAESRRAGL